MKMLKATIEIKSACISATEEIPNEGDAFCKWIHSEISGLGIPEAEFCMAAALWFKIPESTHMSIAFPSIGEIVLAKSEVA